MVAPSPLRPRRTSAARMEEKAYMPAAMSAAGTLDLDDARAQLGELARGERPGDDLLERHHRDSLERPHENVILRPFSPVISVRHVSPGATGWASVSTPVVTISPGRSGGAS